MTLHLEIGIILKIPRALGFCRLLGCRCGPGLSRRRTGLSWYRASLSWLRTGLAGCLAGFAWSSSGCGSILTGTRRRTAIISALRKRGRRVGLARRRWHIWVVHN